MFIFDFTHYILNFYIGLTSGVHHLIRRFSFFIEKKKILDEKIT